VNAGPGENAQWLWGRHAVEEAVRGGARGVKELLVLHQAGGAHIGDIVRLARKGGARVRWVSRKELDRVAQGGAHQGLAIRARGRGAQDLGQFLLGVPEPARKALVLVALDQIQDPHNLGAIARSAACLGAAGLILPERRAAPVTPAAARSSAGAIEKIPVFTVGNLGSELERLKSQGLWIYGADRSGTPLWDATFNGPMVLVIGSEGQGMRSPVRERCDEVVAIPQSPGGVDSLNASCAASVILYEIARRFRNPN